MPGDLPDGWYGAMRISPIGRERTRRPVVRSARQCARHAEGRRRRRNLQLGRRELRPNIPWEDTIIYEAHVKA